jgi:CHAT domain-containing protein
MERSHQNAQDHVAIPRALQSGEIQARLGEGQTVLYYYVGAADAWLFALDAQSFSVHKLGPAATLAALLAAVEQDLRSANGTPAAGLQNLSAFLLPADLPLTGARELLIVPHRDLYKIPFATLARAQAGDSRALIEDFAVKTTPSLTAYFMDKPVAATEHSADIAVFADPLFNTADLRGSAARPDEQPEALQSWSASLERLPYTELEANNLKAVFQPENTLDFLGNRATLANLASAPVRNARILHIATHGYFQSTGSDNVGLVLSAINENNERVPGFVTLTELFGHHFNNELVVISGCDTAMGMQLAGEGMMGLTRGFLAQGARHVISTLWPVSDRASAQFMALFYANLHQLGNVAEALRAAQLELKALPEFRHPYYWAPYVLTTMSPVDAMRFNADVALTP